MIRELAERLQIRHHSTVELVNRLADSGYVQRQRAESDHREVLLTLTRKGEGVLRQLSLHHRAELRKAGPTLLSALLRVVNPISKANSRHRGLPDIDRPFRKRHRSEFPIYE
jgi:DNA-binding MarR family transcriptional regulator